MSDEYPLTHNKDILINTAEWLIKRGNLGKASIPIDLGPSMYLINSPPIHKNGKPFRYPATLSNGLYMHTNFSTENIIELSRRLLKHFGYDPEKLRHE